MRILVDGTVLQNGAFKNSSRSGVFMVAYEILQELLARGHSVDLMVAPESEEYVRMFLTQTPMPVRVLPNGLQPRKIVQATNWLEIHGIVPERRKTVLRAVFWLPYRVVRKVALPVMRKLVVADAYMAHRRQVAALRRYDAFFSPVFLPNLLVRESGLPCYVIIYDALPLLFPHFFNGTQPWVEQLFNGLTERDHCFAISHVTKSDCLKFAKRLKPENVEVIPLAAAERFHPCEDKGKIAETLCKYGIPPDTKYFLSLCSIEPRKNLPFALKAFAAFVKEIPSYKFVLAGGKWAQYAEEWNRALDEVVEVRDRILTPGYVDDEDLSALYSGATAFVYLSLYEGFGLPPLEAMQCGSPVICSNTSSLPEVVGDAALTVSPDNLAETVRAMSVLATDEEMRRSLREKGFERAKQFSWSKAADIVERTMSLHKFM